MYAKGSVKSTNAKRSVKSMRAYRGEGGLIFGISVLTYYVNGPTDGLDSNKRN